MLKGDHIGIYFSVVDPFISGSLPATSQLKIKEMDLTTFRQVAVSHVKEVVSPQNPNTRRVITTYLYVKDNKTFKMVSTKVFSKQQRVANKRDFFINQWGFCKRQFFNQLNK